MKHDMTKAVPIVLKSVANQLYLLAFEHPLAGRQIVKGSVEPGESVVQACARELHEESGLQGRVIREAGSFYDDLARWEWHFCLMKVDENIPDRFTYHTDDGGGLDFAFFWHRLGDELDEEWHEIFHRPIEHIRFFAEHHPQITPLP